MAMNRHIALMRAVNLGGGTMVSMAQLRAMLGKLGFDNPRTLMQSGNAVFGVKAKTTPAALEKKLEAEAARHFGKPVTFMVRTAAEWDDIIERNPFPAEAKSDPAHLLVLTIKGAPTAASVKALRAAYKGPESIEVRGREAYLVYPEGIGRSKLTAALLDRSLGFAGTARNWNTVLKIAALAGE